MKSITLSQSIVGYTIAAQARRLSPHTLADYGNTFRKLQRHLGDPALDSITAADLRAFLNAQTGITNKTAFNIHVGLSALWTWAVQENIVPRQIVKDIQPPVPEIRAIVPFSETDVRALLAALGKSAPYTRPGKRQCQHSLNGAERNRAIVLLLLDTGIRANELCTLTLANADLHNKRIVVSGKGSKERMISLSAPTAQALWRYVAVRPDPQINADNLFLTEAGYILDRHELYKLLARVGHRAGVLNVHPHRFRHTFAISFLRNGGNAYALQVILGHSTMEMVRRYLLIAQADIEAAHRQASPVANWRL